MSNTAPSRADPVVVFPLGRRCPPQETSQPHPPPSLCWINHHQYIHHWTGSAIVLVMVPQLIEAEWCIDASVHHTYIASDNGLSPVWCHAISWTDAAILAIRPKVTFLSEILFKIRKFSFKKIHLTKTSAKWRPFCLGLNVVPRPPNYLQPETSRDNDLRKLIISKIYFYFFSQEP